MSPFYANYGYNLEPYGDSIGRKENSMDALATASKIKGLQEQLRRDIMFKASRIKEYYNKRRRDAPLLKEGDKVYLLRRNIRTKRPSEKLDFKKVGPFRILRKLSALNYELELPKGARIHPIFHVSLLELAPSNAKIQTTLKVEPDEQEYEVEDILDKRTNGRTEEYLVKWKGYDNSENTWEPIKNLDHCRERVRQYQRRNPELTKQEGQGPVKQRPPRKSQRKQAEKGS